MARSKAFPKSDREVVVKVGNGLLVLQSADRHVGKECWKRPKNGRSPPLKGLLD